MAERWLKFLEGLSPANLPLIEKKQRLLRLKTILSDHIDEGAHCIHSDIGKNLANARQEIQKSLTAIDFVINNDFEDRLKKFLNLPPNYSALVMPRGIVVSIMPWNFPVWQLFRVLPWQFWLGNPVLHKPSPYATKTSQWLNPLIQEALGTNFFASTPPENDWSQLEEVISSDKVCGVTFTGSVSVGKKIYELCAKHFKYVSLELGGSDPFIVSEKSTINRMETFWQARLINEGQSCIASKRLLLPEARSEEFLTHLIAHIQKEPWCGRLAHEDFWHRTQMQINQALAEGCQCVWQDPTRGLPAIILCKGTELTWKKEELFAPVVLVSTYKNLPEAISKINQCIFGLAASAWDFDPKEKAFLAENIKSGMIFFNEIPASHPAVSFGGVGASGLWFELGNLGYLPWAQIKILKNLN